jgi:hypothetical protein
VTTVVIFLDRSPKNPFVKEPPRFWIPNTRAISNAIAAGTPKRLVGNFDWRKKFATIQLGDYERKLDVTTIARVFLLGPFHNAARSGSNFEDSFLERGTGADCSAFRVFC